MRFAMSGASPTRPASTTSGTSTTSPPSAPAASLERSTRAGPCWRRLPRRRGACALAAWSPATSTGIRRFWQRWPSRWIIFQGAGSSSASARAGQKPGRNGLGSKGRERRVGRLRESIEAMISLWTNDRTTIDGRYYPFVDAIADPKPIQKPHPPIWIGAGGDQMMLLVARYADVWNSAGAASPEAAGEQSRRLDDLCRMVGRDPAAIRR